MRLRYERCLHLLIMWFSGIRGRKSRLGRKLPLQAPLQEPRHRLCSPRSRHLRFRCSHQIFFLCSRLVKHLNHSWSCTHLHTFVCTLHRAPRYRIQQYHLIKNFAFSKYSKINLLHFDGGFWRHKMVFIRVGRVSEIRESVNGKKIKDMEFEKRKYWRDKCHPHGYKKCS